MARRFPMRAVGAVLLALAFVASAPLVSSGPGSHAGAAPGPHLGAERVGAGFPPQAANTSLWSQLPTAVAPSARGTPGMTYDDATSSVLLFGGGWNLGSGTNDTWSFQGGSWTNLSSRLTTAPSPREDPALAYDAADNEAILFGGYSNYHAAPGASYMVDDTWSYSGGVWTNITSSAGTAPPPRLYGAFVYDPADAEILLFGGQDLASGSPYSDTWVFSHGTWKDLTGPVGVGPVGRGSSAAAYDPATSSVILYGGYDGTIGLYYGDTWSFSGNQWTQLHPSGQPPVVRGASLASMGAGDLVLAAGVDSGVNPNRHSWAFTGTSWTDLAATVTGSPPPAWFAGMVRDSADGVEVFFGGCLILGCIASNGETWELGAGSPPASVPSTPAWYDSFGGVGTWILLIELGLAFGLGVSVGAILLRGHPRG